MEILQLEISQIFREKVQCMTSFPRVRMGGGLKVIVDLCFMLRRQ